MKRSCAGQKKSFHERGEGTGISWDVFRNVSSLDLTGLSGSLKCHDLIGCQPEIVEPYWPWHFVYSNPGQLTFQSPCHTAATDHLKLQNVS